MCRHDEQSNHNTVKEKRVRQIVEACREPQEFYRRLVAEIHESMSAELTAIWGKSEAGLVLFARQGFEQVGINGQLTENREHLQFLHQVLKDGQSRFRKRELQMNRGLSDREIYLAPIHLDRAVIGVIESIHIPSDREAVRHGFSSFLDYVAGETSRFLAGLESPSQPGPQEFWPRFEQFTLQLSRSLRLEEVASVAVNDGRYLLQCDRLALAVKRGRKVEIQAVSGQVSVNARSNEMQALQKLAEQTMKVKLPLLFTGEDQDVPATLETLLTDYLRECKMRSLILIPLIQPAPLVQSMNDQTSQEKQIAKEKRPAIGCLVAENVAVQTANREFLRQLELVAEHTTIVLNNAMQVRRVFGLRTLQMLGRTTEWFRGRKLWKTLAVLAFIAVLIGSLLLIPWEYRITAEGVLMPTEQKPVFAPTNGEVTSIEVESGKRVTPETPLLTLRDDDLQAELTAAKSELHEKQKYALLLRAQIDDAIASADRDEEIRLQGQLTQTQIEIEGLQQTIALLESRKNRLTVKSSIEGVVATFQLKQLLEERPVSRGELLLEVMDDRGEWRLELNVEERRIGHILKALQQSGNQTIPVEFVLATVTEETFTGTISADDMATRTAASQEAGQVVEMFVQIDKTQLPNLRIGAEVRAKIACGQKSLGYCLFGDVVEFVRQRLWL